MVNITGKRGVTRRGFGGLLKEGVRATVIRQQGDSIAIQLDGNKSIWHGGLSDFVLDDEGRTK